MEVIKVHGYSYLGRLLRPSTLCTSLTDTPSWLPIEAASFLSPILDIGYLYNFIVEILRQQPTVDQSGNGYAPNSGCHVMSMTKSGSLPNLPKYYAKVTQLIAASKNI